MRPNQRLLPGLLLVALVAGCAAPLPTPTTTPAAAPAPTRTPAPARTPSATPTPIPLLGHSLVLGRGAIIGAEFLPGAQEVAIAQGGGISLRRVEGAQEVWWHPSDLPVVAMTVHPEGTAIAALLRDRSVLILSAGTGEALRHDRAPRPGLAFWGDIAWSPDGAWIAFQPVYGNANDPVYLLDPETGEVSEVPDSRPATSFTPILIWSPDSRSITARPGTTCLAVLDIKTGQEVVPPEAAPGSTPEQGPGRCFDPIAWMPDGTLLLRAGTNAGPPGLVDPATGEVRRIFQEASFQYIVSLGRLALFSPDGLWLAGGGVIDDFWGASYPLTVWDVETGAQVARLGQQTTVASLEGRANTRVAIAFDGESIVSAHQDGEISRWRFRLGQAGYETLGRVPLAAVTLPWAWSPDSRLLATSTRFGHVAIWSPESPEPLAVFGQQFTGPAFSPDSRFVALLNTETQTVDVVDLASGAARLALPGATLERPPWPLPQQEQWGTTAWSPDGRLIAYRSSKRVLIADSATGEQVAALEGHDPAHDVTYVAWSPRGDALVSIAGDLGDPSRPGAIIVWKRTGAATFEEVYRAPTIHYRYSGWAGQARQALFNPPGNLLAINATERDEIEWPANHIVVIDVDTGEEVLATSAQHYALIDWVSETELGTLANIDGWITQFAWNVRTRESRSQRAAVVGDEAYFGRYFAQEGLSTLVVKNWQTGKTLGRDRHYAMSAGTALWSPDGRWIATMDLDSGLLRLWPVNW